LTIRTSQREGTCFGIPHDAERRMYGVVLHDRDGSELIALQLIMN